MLFNSIDFAIYLPIVFILYWFVVNKNLQLQNLLIVGASYFFYGWWDWRFLSLIFISTIIDFLVGSGLSKGKSAGKRKLLLMVSIFANLGMLGFFKYYDFFLQNFISTFTFFGLEFKAYSLNIILPVGISFYTFQTLSYTIDIYRGKIQATKDFIAFSAFVSFFPQLVAGPIERASNLLPQFYKKRTFDYGKTIDGLRQILWGLFKKVVIADNCAEYANLIFDNSGDYTGSTLVVGAIFFSFQIYGDFSGYSDIAIGTSKLFGFRLMRNFALPYFSRDIAEFWRRWHISLSTWFRDYLYIPLGGSRHGIWSKIRNTFIIFVVSGFWHGANWTFIIWGALNALYFLPLLLLNKNRVHTGIVSQGKMLPDIKDLINIILTYCLTTFAWIFFRAENMGHAIRYISEIFSPTLFMAPHFYSIEKSVSTVLIVILFLLFEWIQRDKDHALELDNIPTYARWGVYYLLVFGIFANASNQETFIYFQF